MISNSVTESSAESLRDTIAAVLGVKLETVFVAEVSQPGTTTPKVVTTNIASEGAKAAGKLAQSIVPAALISSLVQHGFADSVFISATVTACVPGFELVSSVCEPCPVGYYCVGGTKPSEGCNAGYFSASRANSSESCWAADFVMLSVSISFPDSRPETSITNTSLDKTFRLALAAAAQVPLDSVVVNAKKQRPSRRYDEISFKAGIAVIQGTGPEVAERVKLNLNQQLQLRDIPPATLQSLTVTGGGAPVSGAYSSLGIIVGLVIGSCVAVTACLIAPYLASKAMVESEEERLLRTTMQALREHFGITLQDGFALSTETGAMLTARRWRCTRRTKKLAEMVVVRQSYLESAARLALLEVALAEAQHLWLFTLDLSLFNALQD